MIIFFSLIFGILVSLFGYSWGVNNHLDYIPIVLRFLDSEFLKNDFYINSAFYSNQRFYFALIIAFFSKLIGLKYTFLFLTILFNFFNVFLISYFAYKIFRSKEVFFIAAFLSTISLVEIGGASFLTLNYLIPHLIAVSFSLLGIYSTFFLNYFFSLIFFVISLIIHPQIGAMTGLIIYFCFFLQALLKRNRKEMFRVLFFGLLFLVFVISFLFQSKLGDDFISDWEMIYINIFFRHPHHHLLYTIDKITWLVTLSFLLSVVFVIFSLKDKVKHKIWFISISSLLVVVFIIIAGFIFTEFYPIKIIAFAQTLRLFYFIKFLGIIFISGFFLKAKSKDYYLLGLLHPLGFLIYLLYDNFLDYLRKMNMSILIARIFFPVSLLFSVIWLYDLERLNRAYIIFWIVFLVLFAFYKVFYLERRRFLFYLSGFLIFVFLIAVLLNPPKRFIFQKWFLGYKPNFDMTYTHPEMLYLGEFAKKNTNKNSLFLIPPDFGQFRFVGERAVVIDFKSFVFNKKMKQWYQRVIDVYGKPKSLYYYSIIDELNENYKRVTNKGLVNLMKKYNFEYAILFKETKTRFPVVFEYGNYKIITLKNY